MRILISLTLNEVINLGQVLKKIVDKPFKGNIAFKISRLAREIGKEINLFEKEQNKILQRYAQRDKEGNIIYTEDKYLKISSPEEYNEEIKKLIESRIEINVEKIPYEFLDTIEISPADLIILDCVIN